VFSSLGKSELRLSLYLKNSGVTQFRTNKSDIPNAE